MAYKECIDCFRDLPEHMFYIADQYSKIRHPRCKGCHNANRNRYYVKRATGFNKLGDDVRRDIVSMIDSGSSIKDIGLKHNIKLSTLYSWRRNGSIV